jgi:hypothetical protein
MVGTVMTRLFLAAMLSLTVGAARSQVLDEITKRCQADMGQFGEAMVQACVDQDLKSLRELNSYQEAHTPILERCLFQMGEQGYALVQDCVDQDIAALEAMSAYPEEHQTIVKLCDRQKGQYGHAVVKACVDQDIAAKAASKTN